MLVTCSHKDKIINCYYLLSDNPSFINESDISLFAQIGTDISAMSLLLIPSGVAIQNDTSLSTLSLVKSTTGLSPVYTPILSARSLSIYSVEAYFEPMRRGFVLGLSDGTVHFVESGSGFSPLEINLGDEEGEHVNLVPPQKVIFDSKKESSAVVAKETLEKLLVYMDAVMKDSNTRMENVAAVYAENMEIIKAIGKNLEIIKAGIDRNEQKVLGYARMRSEIDARKDDAFSKEEYNALYEKFMKIKEEHEKIKEKLN